jgi:hypothetical protein
MDILPVQASSVPCERVFSSSKETTTPRRNLLSPQVVEALQTLKFRAKHGQELTFTEGFKTKTEVDELEALEAAQPTEDVEDLLRVLTS